MQGVTRTSKSGFAPLKTGFALTDSFCRTSLITLVDCAASRRPILRGELRVPQAERKAESEGVGHTLYMGASEELRDQHPGPRNRAYRRRSVNLARLGTGISWSRYAGHYPVGFGLMARRDPA